MNAIERAGPYGAGNPEPMFVLPAHRISDVAPVGTGHMRFRAQAGDGSKIEGIAFRAQGEPLGNALLAANGKSCHLAGSLSLDRWGGRERVKFRLVDLATVDNNGGRL
jgi:single-stranded-DNA-specific exonuclease